MEVALRLQVVEIVESFDLVREAVQEAQRITHLVEACLLLF